MKPNKALDVLNPEILMIGPHPEDLGGISRVVKNWRLDGLFERHRVSYIPSTPVPAGNKALFALTQTLKVLNICRRKRVMVYIHTAALTSFYRKCLFLIIAWICRCPAILHIHPSYFFSFLEDQPKVLKKFSMSLLKHIRCFVVLSEESLLKVRRLFPATPAFILRNVVHSSLLSMPQMQRAEGRILFLGWYVKEKGIYELIDAVEILLQKGHDIYLECCGTKAEAEVRRYVRQKGLTGRISINGWADDRKKVESLGTSTMLVLPSHTEGMPNVILEAMATGTPVVSTMVGGLSEVLIEGYNAIVAQPGNPEHLSMKIETCLNDRELRKKIADNGRMDIMKFHTVAAIGDRFREIIMSVNYLGANSSRLRLKNDKLHR